MKRKYAVAISAMILSAQLSGPATAVEPSLQQLEEISALLDANDVEALRNYLSVHPDLLVGKTMLAQLLRQYMQESRDPITYLGSRPRMQRDDDDLPQQLRELLAQGDSAPSSGDGDQAEPQDGSDPDPVLY